jgi:hypothetical protein
MDRPTGVTILAVLSFLAGGLLLIIALGALAGGAVIASVFASLPASLVGAGAIILAVVCFVFAALYAANGVGLLKLQNWARLLTIVLIVLGLLSAVLGVFGTLAHFRIFLLVRQLIVAGIDLWILMYLYKPHVKQAFGAA